MNVDCSSVEMNVTSTEQSTKQNETYYIMSLYMIYHNHILSLPIIIYDMTDISYRFPDMISLYYGIVSKTFKRQAYMSGLLVGG